MSILLSCCSEKRGRLRREGPGARDPPQAGHQPFRNKWYELDTLTDLCLKHFVNGEGQAAVRPDRGVGRVGGDRHEEFVHGSEGIQR